PAGRRVAVLGNAGGSLAIAADAVVRAGLVVAEPTRASGLGPSHDLGLHATADDIRRAVEVLAFDSQVDIVLVLYAASLGGTPDEVRAALDAAHGARPEVPVVACFYGTQLGDPNEAAECPVPVYNAIDAAARALGRVAEYAEWLGMPEGAPAQLDAEVAARARKIVQAAVLAGDTRLDLSATDAVLSTLGLIRTETHEVATVDESVSAASAIGYPVVLKARRREAMAKTAMTGLAIDLADESALRAAWERMQVGLGAQMLPATVQPMVARGVDVAIEVESHPEVGPMLSMGPGGASAALDRDVDVRVLPLTDLDAQRLVSHSRVGAVLDEAARQSLERLLLRIGALVEEVPEIVELRADPILVSADGAILTDIGVVVAPLEQEPLPPLRRI
ncbi:MAG: acetate--CoA ligase family protein, partial [Acidimicrobiales bacterium]